MAGRVACARRLAIGAGGRPAARAHAVHFLGKEMPVFMATIAAASFNKSLRGFSLLLPLAFLLRVRRSPIGMRVRRCFLLHLQR